MHTIPPIDNASRASRGPTIPSPRNIRHVNSSVAMVMPEIGLLDEPISPVRRDDTVTNRNPNTRTRKAPVSAAQTPTSGARNAVKPPRSTNNPPQTNVGDRSRSRGSNDAAEPSADPLPRLSVETTAPRIRGNVLTMLNTPAAATQPAPRKRKYVFSISPACKIPIGLVAGAKTSGRPSPKKATAGTITSAPRTDPASMSALMRRPIM